jgi:hypothetical protein
LQLLGNPSSLMQLEQLYPEHFFMFAVIKHSLSNLIKEIHQLYIESHIKHDIYIGEAHIYYRTLRQLHAYHKKTGHPVTCSDVYDKLVSTHPRVLKKLLKWM